ncbi:MAG TPA: hypothetical protein VG099_30815 [Gemmataceae bacterium]|nr:hypothetical protein [Gemmataceae bacterium]
MDERFKDLDAAVPLQGILGYLNFAGGKPDARFQKQLSDACRWLAKKGAPEPHALLAELLRSKLAELRAGGTSAFRDTRQAEAVLALVFAELLPAYRAHHADLLFHQPARELLQPFFLARACEAVLLQGAPWDDEARIVAGALAVLNDYVGHRPMALLETRPKGEPYDHERVRPVPIYIREAGVAWGRYSALVSKALEILATTDAGLLTEAYFDADLLDELAFDPRAYDHQHPVNRRPNYVFGEWDPHHLDSQGRYRRYVARQVALDALLERVENAGQLDPAEVLFEAAAVFAGTILMATGSSGNSPSTHDSTTTLASLMPRIAGYRDAFYASLLDKVGGPHGARLRAEATTTRQPFGGARQHLNQYLARHRAAQLQQRHLSLLFADMGYPEASLQEASRIPAASTRMLSEIAGRLTTGQLLADKGHLPQAVQILPEAEGLMKRGIACGALADPWNILGFQGLFPLFTAREDSIRDARIDELVQVVEQIFNLYSRLVSEAAAAGEKGLREALLANLRKLAGWWDRFASVEVSDIRRVHGGETVASAEHVGAALARWHERGETTADLAFWREHLEGFQSPKAFALVVDALLRKGDYRAALALLMNWLGQAEVVELEQGEYSFHTLALRWMLGILETPEAGDGHERPWYLVKRFFDYLEANADVYWEVPTLEFDSGTAPPDTSAKEEEGLYDAAYAGVTYHDSADDNQEGSVADEGGLQQEFALEGEAERLVPRLKFLATVARLWQIAARHAAAGQDRQADLHAWLTGARARQEPLLALLDAIHQHVLPAPLGSYDSLVEYDRRRSIKEHLLDAAISTCLDTTLAVGTLEGALGQTGLAGSSGGRPEWELDGIRLEQALLSGDAAATRAVLPAFVERFQKEPLLLPALSEGAQPRQILRIRMAQTVLRALVANLPRIGLLRETQDLLKMARAMEQARPLGGRGVTEFNHLFEDGFQAVIETVIDSAASWPPAPRQDQELVDLLEKLTRPFLQLWIEHSQTLQLSGLEAVAGDADWEALRKFVKLYGHDLFHAKFMTFANLRGILHRGVGNYLEYLSHNPDPLQPIKLLDDLDGAVKRADAERWLTIILHALVENYEEYKDYNTTTPQSDYGENLHLLLDFLRLKAGYQRHAWRLRPLVLVHQTLARLNRADLAVSWQEAFAVLTRDLAEQYLARLGELEKEHGMRLGTVADLVQERFIKPLALDRLCALIEPAMLEAGEPEAQKAFPRLQRDLQPFTACPAGVGLDVPYWLRRLSQEVQAVRASQTALGVLAEGLLQVPQIDLTSEQVRAQLEE